VIVDLLVQGDLKVEFALGEGEALADERARQTATTVARGELDLLDSQGKGGALVGFVISVVADVGLDAVLDAKRLAFVVVTGLHGHGARRLGRELHGEWDGVGSQLLNQTVLDGGQLHLGVSRYDLLLAEDHLLAEFDTHDLVLLAAIAIGGNELDKCKYL